MTTAIHPGKAPTHDPVMTLRMRIAARTRSIIAAEYALHDSVQLPVVARRVADVLRDDSEFMAKLDAMLYQVAYEVARGVVGASRAVAVNDRDDPSPTVYERKAKRDRWQMWLEQVGDRHVKLWHMGRVELETAAAQREQRGMTEIKTAAFFRALAVNLEGDQVVGNRYEPAEIDRIYSDTIRGTGGA